MQWHSPVLIPFITLCCNFTCSYCINRFSPDFDFSFSRTPGSTWTQFINSLSNIQDVIFNGGEPTLHPDFPTIINSLKPLRLIAIGTNYSSLATDALLKITPRADLILDGSFHPRSISHHDISQNLRRLKEAGFTVRVHVLNYPGFVGRPSSWVHDFNIQGIDAFIQKYEGFYEGNFYYCHDKLPYCGLLQESNCECSRSIYTPIAPDGNIFFCHYLMYANIAAGILGNISAPPAEFPTSLSCSHLGHCSPCDWPRSINGNP